MKRFEESPDADFNLCLDVTRVVCCDRTDYQELLIFDNPTCGRVLVLDGAIQTTERDEFIYHEMLAHPPILAHGSVQRVLIIGGGDGGALEEVLKHPVKSVTMVEIDSRVIEHCRAHMPAICGQAFEDTRTELIIGDGAEFVAGTERAYDLIVVDSTDPNGPSKVLFEEAFYRDCRRTLGQDGILVNMCGIPYLEGALLGNVFANLARAFDDVAFFMATVPSYGGGSLAFGWASASARYRRTSCQTLHERLRASGIQTRYYDPDVHLAAFVLPGYVRELIC